MRARAERAIAECRRIAAMTEEPGRITRRYLTAPVREVHAHLRGRMEALGMSVAVDAAGNLRGVWRPEGARGKRLMVGSHIDSVPDAGAFDGVLGVVLALEWVELAQALKLALAMEVIAFSEEEGVRFGVPYLGSRAVTGTFDEAMLAYEDADGVRMDAAMRAFGLDPARIGEAAMDGNVRGYVEIHIEQGPVLEAEGLSLAVVEGIIGQSRLGLRFTGQANHAGTTPMALRHDALTAAAEWICAVEKVARENEGLMATVGRIALEPNAGNVIPGTVSLSLDVRHMSNRARSSHVAELIGLARAIAERRGVAFESVKKSDQRAVMMDNFLSLDLKLALEAAGFPVKTMPSGAGHDAMVMAAKAPAAMLFLRSPGGISHNPAEDVRVEDVENSLKVGERFLARLAGKVG